MRRWARAWGPCRLGRPWPWATRTPCRTTDTGGAAALLRVVRTAPRHVTTLPGGGTGAATRGPARSEASAGSTPSSSSWRAADTSPSPSSLSPLRQAFGLLRDKAFRLRGTGWHGHKPCTFRPVSIGHCRVDTDRCMHVDNEQSTMVAVVVPTPRQILRLFPSSRNTAG